MLEIVITKPTPDARLGLSLETDRHGSGGILIARVSRSGLFARTALRAGMELVMVNGAVCQSVQHASALLQQATGRVALQVIAPNNDNDNAAAAAAAGAAEAALEPSSSWVDPESKPGAVEIWLNNDDKDNKPPSNQMNKKNKNAVAKENTQTNTAALAAPNNNNSSNNTFTITVPHSTRLGLRLQQSSDRRYVVVKRIDEESSVFAHTALRVGMRILAVNDYECIGLNVEEVSSLFRSAPQDGALTILVERPPEDSAGAVLQDRVSTCKLAKKSQQQQQRRRSSSTRPSKEICATVHKATPTQPTGVRLKETADRQAVRVDQMTTTSVFQSTPLRVDMIVTAVNGRPVTGWTVQQVADLIRNTTGPLTVHAVPPSKTSSSS